MSALDQIRELSETLPPVWHGQPALKAAIAEIERLQGVKKRSLAIADERAIEAVRLRDLLRRCKPLLAEWFRTCPNRSVLGTLPSNTNAMLHEIESATSEDQQTQGGAEK